MDFSQFKQLALTAVLLTLVGCASAPKSPEYVNQPPSELANAVGNAALGDTIQLPANNTLGLDTVVVDRTYYAASGRECRRLRDASGAPIQRVACKGADGQWRFARNLGSRSSLQSQNRTVAMQSNDAAQSIIAQPLIPSAGSALLLNQDGTVSDGTFVVERPVIESGDSDALTGNIIVEGVAQLNVDSSDETFSTPAESVSYDDEKFAVDLSTVGSGDTIQRELYANETLWSFAQRTTGNALNWKTIAEINNITDAKTLAPGAQLSIPVALVGEGG